MALAIFVINVAMDLVLNPNLLLKITLTQVVANTEDKEGIQQTCSCLLHQSVTNKVNYNVTTDF
jgi:hypothetical protein